MENRRAFLRGSPGSIWKYIHPQKDLTRSTPKNSSFFVKTFFFSSSTWTRWDEFSFSGSVPFSA